LAGFALFSILDAIVKALGDTYSSFQIVFFSALLGFPLTAIVLIRDRADSTLLPVHPWWMALRTGAVTLTGVSAFYAFTVLPLAQTYAIIFATPLLITILSIPVLGEVVHRRRWLAVTAGLVGVLVVLRPGGTELGLGHLAALGTAVGGALNSIIIRKIGHEEKSGVLLLYPMVATVILMGCILPFVYRPMPASDLGGFTLIAVLGFLATLSLIVAYRKGEAVVMAPMQYSQILWATAFGAMFFDELPDRYTIVGATIIIASGLYLLFRESRAGASQHTPVLNTRSRSIPTSGLRISTILRRSSNR